MGSHGFSVLTPISALRFAPPLACEKQMELSSALPPWICHVHSAASKPSFLSERVLAASLHRGCIVFFKSSLEQWLNASFLPQPLSAVFVFLSLQLTFWAGSVYISLILSAIQCLLSAPLPHMLILVFSCQPYPGNTICQSTYSKVQGMPRAVFPNCLQQNSFSSKRQPAFPQVPSLSQSLQETLNLQAVNLQSIRPRFISGVTELAWDSFRNKSVPLLELEFHKTKVRMSSACLCDELLVWHQVLHVCA